MNKYYQSPILKVMQYVETDVIRTSNGDDYLEDDFQPLLFS